MVLNLFLQQSGFLPARLEGARIYLRPPEKGDCAQWVALRQKCAPFQRAYSPASTFADINREGYLRRLGGFKKDWADDRAYVFSIFSKDDASLLGGVTLNNIVRGAGQMATLGYWLDEDARGQGLMAEAVNLACVFSFDTLKLNRVQAGCLLHNIASRRVLEKSGFSEEGIARKYIKIAGAWQDHVIYARLSDD